MDQLDSEVVFKVCKRTEWDAACSVGEFAGSPDDARDGFIHLSTAPQLDGTLTKHFAGHADLVLLAFPAAALGPTLKWEASRGGALFPHLYSPLPTAACARQWPLPLDAAGIPQVPPEALSFPSPGATL